jgi:hypothetical protein
MAEQYNIKMDKPVTVYTNVGFRGYGLGVRDCTGNQFSCGSREEVSCLQLSVVINFPVIGQSGDKAVVS